MYYKTSCSITVFISVYYLYLLVRECVILYLRVRLRAFSQFFNVLSLYYYFWFLLVCIFIRFEILLKSCRFAVWIFEIMFIIWMWKEKRQKLREKKIRENKLKLTTILTKNCIFYNINKKKNNVWAWHFRIFARLRICIGCNSRNCCAYNKCQERL